MCVPKDVDASHNSLMVVLTPEDDVSVTTYVSTKYRGVNSSPIMSFMFKLTMRQSQLIGDIQSQSSLCRESIASAPLLSECTAGQRHIGQ